MNDFEIRLEKLSRPEIKNLKHESMMADQIIKMKRNAALSWWWVLLPAYLAATLVMKSFYFPGADAGSYLSEFIRQSPGFSALVLLVLPLLTIVVNLLAVKKIWFYSASVKPGMHILRLTFMPLLLILASLIIIVIYIILV